MSANNTKIYLEQGGNTQVLEDGATLTLGANAALSIDGTNVLLTGLPTSDPNVAGALWVNTGVLTVSSG